ncbi:hypothetical protein Tco_0522696 [Tanacetum coccineum]
MSCTSRKSVAPARNRILVYPDSDEEDEEYCSLPPLLLCFQTPRPCAIINYVPTQGFTSQFFNQSQHTPNPPLDKEDSSLDEILDELFKIRAENLRKMEHEIPNRCDDITDYVDSDQEDGELPDLPTFPATNEFASDSEQVLSTREWNSRFHSSTWATKWFKRLVAYAKCNRDSYKTIQVEVCGVMLGSNLAAGNHFKTGLVGYHVDDDVGTICDDGCCSRKQTWSMA